MCLRVIELSICQKGSKHILGLSREYPNQYQKPIVPVVSIGPVKPSALYGELDGVNDQVEQDLLDPAGDPPKCNWQVCRDGNGQRYWAPGSSWHRVRQEAGWVESAGLQLEPACVKLGLTQQVGDQISQ